MFCLSNKEFETFRFYLEQRSWGMAVYGNLTDIQLLLPGVPQGSVLCPLVFTMYTRLLGIKLNITRMLLTYSHIFH